MFKLLLDPLRGRGGHQRDHKRSQGGRGVVVTKRSQRIPVTRGEWWHAKILAKLKVFIKEIDTLRIIYQWVALEYDNFIDQC